MIFIDSLSEKIFNTVFDELKDTIQNESVKRSCKNELKEILKEYKDEILYDSLDKFIATNNILYYFGESVDHYLDKSNVFFEDVKKIARQFHNSYKGQLYYFEYEYIMQIFEKLALCIFRYRYSILKLSSEETVVANMKKNFQEGNFEIIKKIKKLEDIIDELIKKMICDQSRITDKKFLFVEKFQQKLFLESNSRNPICLKDVYVSQRYRENGEVKRNIEKCLDDFLFSQSDENILFIVGRIASGKSSLLCKLLYEYRFRNDIIALQIKDFAGSDSLMKALLDKLDCRESELADKILVLDGYDEAKVVKEKDANINKICMDFVQAIQELVPRNKAVKVIITVRTDFFELKTWHEHYENIRVLELLNFDRKQVREFERNYSTRKKIPKPNLHFIASELNRKKIKLISNPMILYMLCHYRGELGDDLSEAAIYEKIFGRRGSMLLNLYKGKGRGEDEKVVENSYAVIKKIAFYIYKKNYIKLPFDSYRKCIPNSDYSFNFLPGLEIIKEDNGLIKEVEFIHDSICSYYAAEYIYERLAALYNVDGSIVKEKVLETIDELFSYGNIKGQVFEFLSYFIQNRSLYCEELSKKVLAQSMEYVCERNCIYKISEYDGVNLLERIHNAFNGYWNTFMLTYSIISRENRSTLILRDMFCCNNVWKNIARLLKNGSFEKLDLRGADFTDSDLRGVILRYSNLSNSLLKNADLRGASLVGTKLCDTDLENANLNGADLCKANLRNSNIKRLRLRGSILKDCRFKGCKNISEVKFNYANLHYIEDISLNDLKKCYVFNKLGKMQKYEDFQEALNLS